ncbi:puromycin-sensitive aminopeptidase-like protein [Temnothorax curvispinosus]|uniref:Puromycin-sensitive aminopeptidase-like protein n=1 Tax=Temnothorax curvispinosus TaxID=300111 RepID=A0A6J1R680_9HYME|nr:puromycin-sensitive aminopeptidase-like protein [Temnothorax curvispinosus]
MVLLNYPCISTRFVHNTRSDFVDIYFANKLSEGRYICQMDFKTILDDLVGVETTYTDENGSIVWLLEADGAQKIFPCWDEPVFKSIFDISIIHLREHTVLSNMPARETYKIDERLTQTHFYETPIISSKLLAIVVSEMSFTISLYNMTKIYLKIPM